MMLTIIIPVYNVEKYITRCLDSILNQDFINFEVILINDGSTDNSLQICKHYKSIDDRIKVFSQENSGVSVARNRGIEMASGQWLCFIDGDDFIEKNILTDLINIVNTNNIDCVIAKAFIKSGNQKLKEKYPLKNSIINKNFKGLDLAINEGYFRGSIWSVLYKKELLLNNNILFPTGIKNGEDTIFFSKILMYAQNIHISPLEFYNVYEREGSASRSWSFERILLMINNIKYLQEYIKNNNLNLQQTYILNYNIYRVVSTMFNTLSLCFSFSNYFKLNNSLKKVLTHNIDTGNLKIEKRKIKLLNTSIYLFSASVILKNIFKK